MPSAKFSFDLSDPLAQAKGETPKASQALHDYATMGPGRSLRKLSADYQEQEHPPTKRLATLEKWSSKYSWQARVALFDLAEFEKALGRYYDDREKWRVRRENLLELAWAKIATILTMWQPGSMFDEAGRLKGGVSELMTAVRTIADQTRIEHEGLPDFTRGGESELSAAVNALISRELVRLAGRGEDHTFTLSPPDSDGSGE